MFYFRDLIASRGNKILVKISRLFSHFQPNLGQNNNHLTPYILIAYVSKFDR
jgi:hypothetical protein